ncbi:hypothetical protein [Mesorhizobium sp. RMAD-H1]|uniref:hypothetical protein n=1 Tax=Mesorhizobium sp. RMAD-H1 TaxID=2587065 RepID=UPI00161C28FE|nr:hypothetical protein [Mesorhizobium sp. RMAD-H1]MBB2974435.1 hypothetical protein [Mesorhizobium sp. RMAD-H1]
MGFETRCGQIAWGAIAPGFRARAMRFDDLGFSIVTANDSPNHPGCVHEALGPTSIYVRIN